eukprot:GHVP01053126.1.p1 GENE.GHVP01053126.1~~GHVP01053126.1.p1  ORF type:complete len:532 (+),score=87.37 GHVP01053126.1:789-2384(+)
MGSVCGKSTTVNESETRRDELSVSLIKAEPFISSASRIRKGDMGTEYVFQDQVAGTGFSGPVRLAVLKKNGILYAVKSFCKDSARKERFHLMKNEAEVFLQVDHPNIARLIEIWENSTFVHIVMEYCSGKELFDHLCARKVYAENDAKVLVTQMLSAINYLHCRNIVHRDLKLENWMFESSSDEALKLIDFGFAKIWNPVKNQKMHATCGTLAYVSPDTLLGGYTNACDMWSLGVIVYLLLVGYPPFFGLEEHMYRKILDGDYSVSGPRWQNVTYHGREFVTMLLETNPTKRLTAKQAMEHPWLSKKEENIRLDDQVIENMRKFAELERFKRTAVSVIAYSLTSAEIRGIKEHFLAIDTSREGTIKVEELQEALSQTSLNQTDITRIFDCMDSSRDSEISYNDFIAAMICTKIQSNEELLRLAFQRLDIDNSGFITLQNLKDILGGIHNERVIESMFAEIDFDSSGQINFEDFLVILEDPYAPSILSKKNRRRGNRSIRFSSGKEEELRFAIGEVVEDSATSRSHIVELEI